MPALEQEAPAQCSMWKRSVSSKNDGSLPVQHLNRNPLAKTVVAGAAISPGGEAFSRFGVCPGFSGDRGIFWDFSGVWKAPWLPSDVHKAENLPGGPELRASSQPTAGWRQRGGKLSLGEGSRSQAQDAAQHRTCKREKRSSKEVLCGLHDGTAYRATAGSHERVASPGGVLRRGVPRQVLNLGRCLHEHSSLMSFSYTGSKHFHVLPHPSKARW